MNPVLPDPRKIYTPDVYEKGLKIREQALPFPMGDQEEYRYSVVQNQGGSTASTYDLQTISDSIDLIVLAIRVSNNITSNLQRFEALRKKAVDDTYYVFDGGYFLYNNEYILPAGYMIPSGDTLAMSLYNYSGSTATFEVIFTGFSVPRK